MSYKKEIVTSIISNTASLVVADEVRKLREALNYGDHIPDSKSLRYMYAWAIDNEQSTQTESPNGSALPVPAQIATAIACVERLEDGSELTAKVCERISESYEDLLNEEDAELISTWVPYCVYAYTTLYGFKSSLHRERFVS